MRRPIVLAAAALSSLCCPAVHGQIVTRLSVDPTGLDSDDNNVRAMLSLNGEVVSFTSSSTNLVAADTNFFQDVFVRLVDAGVTELVSVDSAENLANGASSLSSINADGTLVAFVSYATNLVAGDTNGVSDVFVRDRTAGTTERVSLDTSGGEGNGDCANAAISTYDGRYVTFDSDADNLVAGDTNGDRDVFLHDRWTGVTTRISVDSGGVEGNGNSYVPTISEQGRYIAFMSAASNLVAGDTNGENDVFLHDFLTGTTTRVSVDSAGNQGNNWSQLPSISGNGENIAFNSFASNLVTGDTNGQGDIFVHNRVFGTTERVSISSGGVQGDYSSGTPHISSQGLRVAFTSFATNLVADDANGYTDAFVHDRVTGETIRVSTDADDNQADSRSFFPTLDLTGDSVAFHSYATNLVAAGDFNGFTDVYLHQNPSVEFPLEPGTGESVAFELYDAPDDVGFRTIFFLSCSGTDGFQLGPHTVPLTFDACTLESIRNALALMGIVDANGHATSPTFLFPQVPPGTTLYIAAATRGAGSWSTITSPLIVRPR